MAVAFMSLVCFCLLSFWHSGRVLQAEHYTPTCLGSIPVKYEDEVIPATEVLEVVQHLPAYT